MIVFQVPPSIFHNQEEWSNLQGKIPNFRSLFLLRQKCTFSENELIGKRNSNCKQINEVYNFKHCKEKAQKICEIRNNFSTFSYSSQDVSPALLHEQGKGRILKIYFVDFVFEERSGSSQPTINFIFTYQRKFSDPTKGEFSINQFNIYCACTTVKTIWHMGCCRKQM